MILRSTSFGCNFSQDLSRMFMHDFPQSYQERSSLHIYPPPKKKKAPNPPTGWCSTRENGSRQQLSHPLLILLITDNEIEVEYLLETPISQVSRSFPTPTKPSILFLETTTKRQETCHALWPKAMVHRARLLDHPNSPCSYW